MSSLSKLSTARELKQNTSAGLTSWLQIRFVTGAASELNKNKIRRVVDKPRPPYKYHVS